MTQYRSEAQRRFAHSDKGQRVLGKATVQRWDADTADAKLPERVTPQPAKKQPEKP